MQMRTPGFGDSDWTRVISELRLAGFKGVDRHRGLARPGLSRRAGDDRAGAGAQLSEGVPRRAGLRAEPGLTTCGIVTRQQTGGTWDASIRNDLTAGADARRRSAAALLARPAPPAQALRDKWCKDVNIRFFVGGAEGDAFGTIVYNGAKQAAADTGREGRLRLLRLGDRRRWCSSCARRSPRSPTASP